MMTGRQLTGLLVRDRASGKKAGRISDIYADQHSGQIRGFGVAGDGFLSRPMLLPASAVESIGLNGFIADTSALKRLSARNDRVSDWRGASLRSELGRELGVVSDVILDEGRVAALEISGGLLSDVSERRSLVSWDSVRPDAEGGFIRYQQGR